MSDQTPRSSTEEILQLASDARKLQASFDITVRGQGGQLTIKSEQDGVVFDFGSMGKFNLNGRIPAGLHEQLMQLESKPSYNGDRLTGITLGQRSANLLARAIEKSREQAQTRSDLAEQDLVDDSESAVTPIASAAESESKSRMASSSYSMPKLSPEQQAALKKARVDSEDESGLFAPGFRATLSDGTPVVLACFGKGEKLTLKWASEKNFSEKQRRFLASFDMSQSAGMTFSDELFEEKVQAWDMHGQAIVSRRDNGRRGKPLLWYYDAVPRGIKIVSSKPRGARR